MWARFEKQSSDPGNSMYVYLHRVSYNSSGVKLYQLLVFDEKEKKIIEKLFHRVLFSTAVFH